MSNFGEGNPYFGGGGGGGFVQGGSPYASQSSPGGTKKRAQTIRPVTVKQLQEASQVHNDADFTIDGVDVGQILLIGSIHNKSASHTNVSYEIGDGTGYIDVRQWLDTADDDTGKMDGIEQDKYIAILGTIKVFGGKRHISATHIRPITDHNEVYNHLLRALYVSLQFRNPGGARAANANGGGDAAGAVSGDYSAGATTGGVDTSAYAALPPVHKQIMELVVKEDSDDGVHVSTISRQIGGNNGQAVMDAIEYLMSEGLLFSTIDDLHVKAV